MLHVRDCSGLLSNGDVCPFPWCRKVKHLLYHLVSCEDGKKCTICCNAEDKLSSNLQTLVGLNTHRRNKFRERVKAALAKRQQMSAAARGSKPGAKGHVKLPAQRANTLVASTSQVSKPRVTYAASEKPPASATVAAATHVIYKTQSSKPSPIANPASAAVAAAASQASSAPATGTTKTAINPPQHQQQQIPSPSLSASLSGLPSALSVSGLPTL